MHDRREGLKLQIIIYGTEYGGIPYFVVLNNVHFNIILD
jgi:hypothetical protein